MRISGATMSFISLPSPKGKIFREGPKTEKRKSPRSLRKVLTPIRKFGRQLSKRVSKNSQKETKDIIPPDVEQGWIAPATTFETEDTLSPRSFDTLTTSDSTSFLGQTGATKEEEILFCSVHDSSQQDDDEQFFDLEAGFNESAKADMVFRGDGDVQQEYTYEAEYNENTPENCEPQYAAPPVEIENDLSHDSQERSENEYPTIQELGNDRMTDEQEETRHSMVSLLSQIDTTEVIDETNEIDSLIPAADISFFLNEDEGDDFHCVGRLSTPQKNEEPPVQIDVDSIDDLSNNSPSHPISDDESRGLYIEDEDEFSLSSYSSYIQAIESVTASASEKVQGAFSLAMAESEEDIPFSIPLIVDSDSEPELGTYDEDDCCRVSFNPSRELILQAMEGASAKAKADIERATELALSKMNSANYACSKRQTLNSPNRVLGFLFVVLLMFQFNSNSFQFFQGLKSISHSVGIDEFQIQAHNNILIEPQPDLGRWGDKQTFSKENHTEVVQSDVRLYNIGCDNKIACLALGNI